MFAPDDDLATMIFEYCRWRLALDPVELDLPGDKATLDRALDGLLTPGGRDAASVLSLFTETLAAAVISCVCTLITAC